MKEIRVQAIEIVRRLQQAGFEAFWVGGCVRDFLLGREPGDYDVATSAKPDQIEKLFPHTVAVGKQFGVILVVVDEHDFEVATFRAESDYVDGRHPDRVVFSSAQADAQRRDFTVNGLFYDPIQQRIYDWVGGENDLRARILRTIGRPAERFGEDHLRLLRAIRFAAQLHFQIDPETFSAVRENSSLILKVSAERIRDELVKLFLPPHAAQGLELLEQSGLLAYVLPEITATIHCEQSPEFHPEGTVFRHILKMLGFMRLDAPTTVPWAVLFHDVAKPLTASKDPETGSIHFFGHEKVGAELTEEILRRLKFPRKSIDEICACVRYHMQFKDIPKMRKSTIRRLILRPTFPVELELHRLDCLGSHGLLDIYELAQREAKALLEQPQLMPPLLNGSDLIEMGMEPGPEMGDLLRQIRDKQLQEELSTPEQARTWAKQQLGSNS